MRTLASPTLIKEAAPAGAEPKNPFAGRSQTEERMGLPSFFRKAGKIASIGILSAAILIGCSSKAAVEQDGDSGPGTDTSSDVDTDSDSDLDSDSDTDTESDTGDGGPDTDSGTDLDTDTDSDTDSDSDGDTDTQTETEDTDTATETETEEECPDTDTGLDYDTLAWESTGFVDLLVSATADDSFVCNLVTTSALMATTENGLFEITGINPYWDFEPSTREGNTIYILMANNISASSCADFGMNISNGAIVLESTDDHNFAFEISDTATGKIEINYIYGTSSRALTYYDYSGFGYPTASDANELWLSEEAGIYGPDAMVEGFGASLRLISGIRIYSVLSPPTLAELIYRLDFASTFAGLDVYSASPSSMSACGFQDNTAFTVGEGSFGAVYFEEADSISGTYVVLHVPESP
jgi:hypothetical protein